MNPCLVKPLFTVGSPSAIGLSVAKVILLSIKGVILAGRLTHISREVFKGGQPPLANRDTFTTIPIVVDGLRVIASGLHVLPDGVQTGNPSLPSQRGVPMSCVSLTCPFTVEAPAGLGVTTLEVAGRNFAGLTTGAYAVPVGVPLTGRHIGNCCEPSEFLVG